MSPDFITEELISFKEASKRLPGNPSICTMFRWANKGIKGIRLQTMKCGGSRKTSLPAVYRFYDAITAKVGGERVPEPSSNTMKASSRVLDEAGI